MKLARKQVRKLKRLEAIQRQQSREEEVRKHRLRAVSSVDESESFNVGDGENSDDSDFEVNERNIRVPKTRRVISNDYLAMLDRSKMSVRYAAAVSLTLLGDDAGTSVMSKSTIHRERVKFRQESQKDEELIHQIENMGPLTLHWDGKLLLNLICQERVDRLPVLVCAGNKEFLLGVPKIMTGTGLQQAIAVTDLIKKYKLVRHLIGMVFDTTLSNTGPVNGACALIEEILGVILLWLACRHHVLEIALKDVFHLSLGPNKGPTFPLFERFILARKTITPASFESIPDTVEAIFAPNEKEAIISFCTEQLQVSISFSIILVT